MALIRWEPVREIGTIQNEVNRLFNTFFDTPLASSEGAGRRWLPAMDLVEGEDHYTLRADLPGVAEGDVKIEVEDHVLTLSGERKSEHEDRKGRATLFEHTTARDIMTSGAVTIEPDADVREAAQRMLYGEVRRLFVEEKGRLVGVLSQTDIAHAMGSGRL